MNIKKKKIPEKYLQLPLVPEFLILPLWVISLCLPNLIYSGIMFADTLHIIKWTVTGVPIAIALFFAGLRISFYGREKISVKPDLFALLWALILIYCAVQPLWVKLSSPTGYVLEMVCFAAIWAFYVISVEAFPEKGLRVIILLCNVNAAINVLFAELQIRDMNNLAFLNGTFLSDLQQFSNIILPTPGNYIGNTAQQNMFGLWEAVACLGAVYLFVFDAWNNDRSEHGRKIWVPVINIALSVICLKFAVTEASILFGVIAGLFIIGAFIAAFRLGNEGRVYYSVFILLLLCVNFWGLMSSTSRSATLALLLGLSVLLLISAWKFDRNYVIRFFAVMLVISSVFYASMYSPRSGEIVEKTADIIKNAENIGLRRGIWMTSYAMLREHPEGVGIGQYKWHYLEGQRYGFSINNADWYGWQYTHWAHNEFLQFFCEGGYIGGILLLLLWLVWFVPAVYGLFKKKRMSINITAVWALSLVSLITFCAVFTRPFHRIENMVWITLAFALCNREFFPDFKLKLRFDFVKSKFFRSAIGLVCVIASISGCIYISGGIYGNYVLRQALSTQDERIQLYLLNEADKYPIVREEAQRNLGYHLLQIGEQKGDNQALVQGFNVLWSHFNREPHSEDISRLINFAQRYQLVDVLREIASYFKPGMYHLQRVPQRDSSGKIINALLLLNGPGSDDQ